SRVLRPAGLLNRPRRPLSRGFDQASCPARPLVSYQSNRQLSGWNLPPLVNRAFRAHREIRAEIGIMAGKSPVTVDEEQRQGLLALSHSRDRGEADRARAILLTLSGWTSGQIAQAFGVREDTVRFWRSAFMTGGIEALKKSTAPGPAPVKAERALAVAEE